MTKISYVSGVGRQIPADEYAQRGMIVPAQQYIPFASMTEGQMNIAILRNHAASVAKWSEDRGMEKAAVMLQNSLDYGVHGVAMPYGHFDEAQMWAYQVIAASKNKTRAAMSGGGYSRVGELIDTSAAKKWIDINREFVRRYQSLLSAAGYFELVTRALSTQGYTQNTLTIQPFTDIRFSESKRNEMRAYFYELADKYTKILEVEKIYNQYLPTSSHHVVYFPLSEKYDMPDRVFSKRLLHGAGVEGLADAANVQHSTIELWVGSSINTRNLSNGVGNMSALETGLALSGNDLLYLNYQKQFGVDKTRGGAQIGVAQVVVLAIISLISAAVAAAATIVSETQKTKQAALSQAKGFGTPALSAAQTDWKLSSDNPPTGGSSNNNMLLLAAAAGGAYLLLND